MVTSSGATQAQPSSLSTDNTSFSVAWVGATSTTTTGTASLVVGVATNQGTYPQNSWAYITVHVTDSSTGLAISGASVTVTVTDPSGGTAAGSGTTNSNGDVTFKYRIGPNAPLGTYTVSATASASGYNTGSASTTFQVT